MKKVKGLDFNGAYESSIETDIDGVLTRVIHKNQLIKAKRASNRPKDQQDDIDPLLG